MSSCNITCTLRKTTSNSYNLSVQQLTASEILQVPRLSTSQRTTAAFQVEGGIVYDTDLDNFYIFISNAWQSIPNGGDYLLKSQNLADLPNKSTARSNLGLGSAATHAAGDFCQTSNNLSDVQDALIASSNLLNSGYYVNPIGNDVNMNLIVWYTTDGYVGQSNISLSSYMQNKISSLALIKTNNLSDVSSVSSARTNLGLGSAATQSSSAFLQTANNLSDISNTSTARLNLGLGSAATNNTTDFLQTSNNLSDIINVNGASTNLLLNIDNVNVSDNFHTMHPVCCDFSNDRVVRTNESLYDFIPNMALHMYSSVDETDIDSTGRNLSSFSITKIVSQFISVSGGQITFNENGYYLVKFGALVKNQDASALMCSIGFQAVSGTPPLTWASDSITAAFTRTMATETFGYYTSGQIIQPYVVTSGANRVTCYSSDSIGGGTHPTYVSIIKFSQ